MTKPIVAAFDFDGTLTRRDTFIPFTLFVAGPKKWILNMARLVPWGFLFLIGAISRQQLKEKTIALFFHGMPISELRSLAEEFAAEILPDLVKKKALETLKWHQSMGHRIVVISASPELYLRPWGRSHQVDDVLASRLEVDAEGKITGRLDGLNCRGPEKTRRLEGLLGSKENYELYAYGDSPGDRELLDLADHRYFRKI